ncbi:puromycin-sensitive aminopeptidase [Plakobranchus ocellatus]|uniref:Aminopeptidase n=1 Tax=Plakobranchus ocellatus TaxID=259542 RepID=A0AAV4CKM8_9GAST|nr:puromycin-sensitive aminopeptidase [Plakobranchus ocellatus]
MDCRKAFQRLPKNVVPKHYKLKLKPDLEKFKFEGSEEISVEVVCPTHKIKMNSVDIEVQEASYKVEGVEGAQEAKASINYCPNEEELVLDFPCQIQCGKGILSLKFTGELNDKMKGFYRSKYTLGDEEKYAAVTQFEAVDARRAFPCWDEPALKATFDVTLIAPKDKVALSNMPIISDKEVEDDSGLKEVSYATTPVMSTYLLAFVVGEFDYVEATDSNGVTVKVYTPVGKSDQGKFALDVAVKTLPFYNDYFGIAYPLPKVDLIAIPDFSAGAMENWGLITYRETALLVDPEQSSARIKQWVALVVGHELAHQWFGNLVTMEWWTHLWLNEGFASWIEYLCVDYCFPEYDVWTQFVNNDLGQALEMDALDNSHPIEVEVGHPSEVDEIFDAISYSKGSSVIRMLHDYLGDVDFRKGMNIYLTRHQYSNTSTENLWAALEEASGKPVGEMMATWTKQKGFPVLKVEQEQCGKDRHLTIVQSKFMAGGEEPPTGYRWMVPISVLTQAQPDQGMLLGLMDNCQKEFCVHYVARGQWLKLNAGTVGFYRVMYPSEMLQALMPAVKDLSLPPKDRLGLQSDLFALSRAGLTPAVDVLRTVGAYKNEKDFTVWSNLSSNLASISAILQYSDCYPAFKTYVIDLFSKIVAEVGWDPKPDEEVGWDPKPDEDTLTPLLREVVLARVGRYSDPGTVAEANKRFNAHCAGDKKLPADLKSAVYATVLSNGDVSVYEKMLKLYDEAEMQEERVRIGRALGSVKDKDLIQKVLFFAMSEKVRAQDAVFVISGCTGSAEGRELAWKFFQENFHTLSDRYEGGFLLSRLVQATTENFASEEKATEVEHYFKEHPLAAAERTIQQSIENIRLNAKWLAREEDGIKKFLGCDKQENKGERRSSHNSVTGLISRQSSFPKSLQITEDFLKNEYVLVHNKVISGFSGPPSGQGASGRARTSDRKVPADLRADSLDHHRTPIT